MTPEQELDLRMAEPAEGEILRITAQYPESPKTYTYTAVGFEGFWYISGIASSARKNWEGLINFFKSRNIDILSLHRATSWEDLL